MSRPQDRIGDTINSKQVPFVLLVGLRLFVAFIDLGMIVVVAVLIAKLSGAAGGGLLPSFLLSLSVSQLSILTLCVISFRTLVALSVLKLMSWSLANREAAKAGDNLHRITQAPAMGVGKSAEGFAWALNESSLHAYFLGRANLLIIIGELASLILIGFYLLVDSPSLGALAVASIVGGGVPILVWSIGAQRKNSGDIASAYQKLYARIIEIFDLAPHLRFPGNQEFVSQLFDRAKHPHSVLFGKQWTLFQLPRLFLEGILFSVIALMAFIFSTSEPSYNAVTGLSLIVAAIIRMMSAYGPVQSAINGYVSSHKMGSSALLIGDEARESREASERVFRIHGDLVSGLAGKTTGLGLDLTDEVVFRNVSVEFPERALTALYGESGSGKTSFLEIIAGEKQPSEGTITWRSTNSDGRTISVHDLISYVPASPKIFAGTVFQNVAMDFSVDWEKEKRVADALAMVELSGLLDSLSQGMHSPIGGTRRTLSSGELQRLALARAIFRKAPVLVLDEPTSSLDSENGQAVVSALASITSEVTVIVATHDPAFVRVADKLLRVHHGEFRDWKPKNES